MDKNIIDNPASRYAVGRRAVGRRAVSSCAEGTLSQKVRLPDVSN